MSKVFNGVNSVLAVDTVNYKVSNIGSDAPSTILDRGQIYSKSDGLLYFLNPSGVEYLLSATIVINTEDFLHARSAGQITTTSASGFDVPWNTSVTELANVSINGTNTIINIGTAGTYYISYNIEWTCNDSSVIGANPSIESHIVLNGNNGNGFTRYGANEENVISFGGNLRYSTTVHSFITVTSNSNIILRVIQTTGSNNVLFSGINDASTEGRFKIVNLNVHRVFGQVITGDYLHARRIGQTTPTSGTPYDVLWDTTITQNGNLSINSGNNELIDITTAGLYSVTYNVEWTCTSGLIDGANPRIASHIVVDDDDAVTEFRYGVDQQTIMVNSGNLRHSVTRHAIIKLAGGQNLQLRVTQTMGTASNGGTGVRFSGLNDSSTDGIFKITNLHIYRMSFTDNQTLVARVITEQTPASGVLTAMPWTQSSATGSMTVGAPTSRIVFGVTGTYEIVYSVDLDGTSITGDDPRFESFMAVNTAGAPIDGDYRFGQHAESVLVNAGALRHSVTKSAQIVATAADYVELFVRQTTGTAITLSGNAAGGEYKQMSISVIRVK